MRKRKKVVVKGIVLVLLFLCVAVTWFYLEFWLPHRTIYDNLLHPDIQEDYILRKKVRDACHKVLSYRIGNFNSAFNGIVEVGDKDSIPYLIRTLKRLNQKSENEMPFHNHYTKYCVGCLRRLTGMKLGLNYKDWEDWWEQTGRHLPFDEEKGHLILQDEE